MPIFIKINVLVRRLRLASLRETSFVHSVKTPTLPCLLGILVLLSALFVTAVKASASTVVNAKTKPDSTVKTGIEQFRKSASFKKELAYPESVSRFYTKRENLPVWVQPINDKLTWEGMLLVDCVLQFGFEHRDFHPNDISNSLLHKILEQPALISNQTKARFDIMLTDALITLINHLHFGKLNPAYPASRIDQLEGTPLRAEQVLHDAIAQNNLAIIDNVQPKSRQYWLLQENMRLITMQYTGDCYEMPEGDIQMMAINMERLRWINSTAQTYIQVNIPAFKLSLVSPDTTYHFRVIVGKPQTPTPSLQSSINYFTTAPEWRIPKKIFEKELLPKVLRDSNYLENNHIAIYNRQGNFIKPGKQTLALIKKYPQEYYAKQSAGCDNALGNIVFRFPNIYDVYLHDTPEKHLFKQEYRALSHGCIRVEHPEELAVKLFKFSGTDKQTNAMRYALSTGKTKNFQLVKPVPIMVTYLTCEYINGALVKYKDIYGLDQSLGKAMFGNKSLITNSPVK